MQLDVIVKKNGNRYLAQVRNLPAIQAREDSREAALARVAERARHYFADVEVVRIEIGGPDERDDLLSHFGSFADDPTFDDLQAQIAVYRQERNRVLE